MFSLFGVTPVLWRVWAFVGIFLTLAPACAQAVAATDPFEAFMATCPQSRLAVGDGHATAVAEVSQAWTGWSGSTVEPSPVYRGVPRLGVWGDSHTASGHFVDATLALWGAAPARVKSSRIAPAFGVPGVRLPLRQPCVSRGWTLQQAHRASKAQGGFSSTLMHLSSDTPGDALWLDFGDGGPDPALRWLNLRYTKAEPQRVLLLGLSINHGPETLISLTDATQPWLQIHPPGGLTTLRLRLVAGQITLHALEPVYTQPPQWIVDVFSTPGAMAKAWGSAAAVSPPEVPYDMAIFQYGTNEASDAEFDPQTYASSLRQSLGRFRFANARARCVLVGVPDRANRPGGPGASSTARHRMINQVQERVSREFQCEFWNWQAAMDGGIQRWSRARPALAQADGIHLTGKGYELSARSFAEAIRWRSRPHS